MMSYLGGVCVFCMMPMASLANPMSRSHCQMHSVEIPAILSTVTNLGCICKCIFDDTGFSKNIKKTLF